MKKCVVVSDSFKGTLSSLEICNIARQSVPRFFPSCQVVTVPVADGGEGTVECFIQVGGYAPEELTVSGPWGEPSGPGGKAGQSLRWPAPQACPWWGSGKIRS